MLKSNSQKSKVAPKAQLPFNPDKPLIAELERLGFEISSYNDSTSFNAYGPEEQYDDNDNPIETLYGYDDTIEFGFDYNSFEFCCGATEFGSFSYSGPKEFEVPVIKYTIQNFINGFTGGGMLVATDVRDTAVATTLRALGFEEQQFTNPNTKNKLSFFTLIVNQGRKKRR